MTVLEIVASSPSGRPSLAEQPLDPVLALVQRNAGLLSELEHADGLDSVLRIHEQASALSALARAARVSLEQQNQLAMTRVRVQHRAGSMLRDLSSEPRPGRAKRPRGTAPLRPQLPRGVLQQHGISGQESSAWQALASLPIAEVARRMDELAAAGQEITSSEFYRRGRASLRTGRSSRIGASPAALRLSAALANLRRIRTLTTPTERELAIKIALVLVGWGVGTTQTARCVPNRPDLERIVAACLLCGRERQSMLERRCSCGGNWTTTLR
jgi:hypothetical protein